MTKDCFVDRLAVVLMSTRTSVVTTVFKYYTRVSSCRVGFETGGLQRHNCMLSYQKKGIRTELNAKSLIESIKTNGMAVCKIAKKDSDSVDRIKEEM